MQPSREFGEPEAFEGQEPGRRPRPKIRDFMIATAFVALFLALPRYGRSQLYLVFAVGVLYPFITGAVRWRCDPLPAVLVNPPGDPEAHIEALERALAAAPDDRVRAVLEHSLVALYQARQRHQETITLGRALLQRKGVPRVIAADVHLQIADSLDRLGRPEEVETELAQAEAVLDGRPAGVIGWTAQGKLLDRRQRFREAVDAYQSALALVPSPERHKAVRRGLYSRLMLASLNAGLGQKTVEWAERVLAGTPGTELALSAHRVAAVGYAKLGRLDDAERHHRLAYEMARSANDTKLAAQCLANVAGVQRSKGDLAEAEATAREAASMAPEGTRDPHMMLSAILSTQGRFAEALECIERAQHAAAWQTTLSERRLRAALTKQAALCKLRLGRVDAAWSDFHAAEPEIRPDAKLSLSFDAARVRLLAASGQVEATVRTAEDVLQRIEGVAEDPTLQCGCVEMVGRGLCDVGEYEAAARCWERALSMEHVPVTEPTAWYHLGECRAHLGDPAGARDCFARATAVGIDSHHARLAAERLAALTSHTENAETLQPDGNRNRGT